VNGPPLSISAEVTKALAAGKPVVALETTIVSHGMPRPANLETALAVEDEVRKAGATPAAIAVMAGVLRIGLDQAELEGLAKRHDVLKLSSADLAYGLMTGRTGATTVAATMIAARLAGIGVFATGGIGGVHRGAETSFDISADLTELGRTGVVVPPGNVAQLRTAIEGLLADPIKRRRLGEQARTEATECRSSATGATSFLPSGRDRAASPRQFALTTRRPSPGSCRHGAASGRRAACSSPIRFRRPMRFPQTKCGRRSKRRSPTPWRKGSPARR